MFPSDYRLSDLPSSLEDLSSIIGFVAVLKLIKTFGGIRVHIPTTCTAAHPLAVALGLDAALALCAHLGGDKLDIPRAKSLFSEARNREILANVDGLSVRELALKYQLDTSSIKKIRATREPEPDEPQNVHSLTAHVLKRAPGVTRLPRVA